MNFLQLCQRAWDESELAGSGPTDVTSQTGKHATIVNLVRSAAAEIEGLHHNWNFLFFDSPYLKTLAGTQNYNLPTIPVNADGSEWRNPRHIRGVWMGDEVKGYRRITLFRQPVEPHLLDKSADNIGNPVQAYLTPTNALIMNCRSEDVENIRVQFYARHKELQVTTDVPDLPEVYHPAIVYRAVMLHALREGDTPMATQAAESYERYLNQLETEQLPKVTFATSEFLE